MNSTRRPPRSRSASQSRPTAAPAASTTKIAWPGVSSPRGKTAGKSASALACAACGVWPPCTSMSWVYPALDAAAKAGNSSGVIGRRRTVGSAGVMVGGGLSVLVRYSAMSLDRVFVIGAGLMGHGIAQVSAGAGKQVTLADRTAELAEAGRQRIAGNLARQVEKGRLTQDEADTNLARIGTAAGPDGVPGHQIVIEAVFEDESVKRETWQHLSAAADGDAIFASNTSSISITALATATDRPGRFIGLHFFSPVPVMGLVEIIRGLETDDATLTAARGFRSEERRV